MSSPHIKEGLSGRGTREDSAGTSVVCLRGVAPLREQLRGEQDSVSTSLSTNSSGAQSHVASDSVSSLLRESEYQEPSCCWIQKSGTQPRGPSGSLTTWSFGVTKLRTLGKNYPSKCSSKYLDDWANSLYSTVHFSCTYGLYIGLCSYIHSMLPFYTLWKPPPTEERKQLPTSPSIGLFHCCD